MSVGKIKAFVQMAAFSFSLILALIPNAQAKDPLIEQMISTYQANQARFHMNHRGQTLTGEGTVTGIKTDPLGTGYSFYIYLDVNGSKVNCDTKNQKAAASMDKGQRVKFSGRIHDVVFGALNVSDCGFQRADISNRESQPKPIAVGDSYVHICDRRLKCRYTIQEISGLSTSNAVIKFKETKADKIYNCTSDSSNNLHVLDEKQCKNPSQYNEGYIKADCSKGLFYDGKELYFKVEASKSKERDFDIRMFNREKNEWWDSSLTSPSAYDILLKRHLLLCPLLENTRSGKDEKNLKESRQQVLDALKGK